jgi:hypothetical protein
MAFTDDGIRIGGCNCPSLPCTKEGWAHGLLWQLRKDVLCKDQWRRKRGYLYKNNPCDVCKEQSLCNVLSDFLSESKFLEKGSAYYSGKDKLEVSRYIHVEKGGSLFAAAKTAIETIFEGYPGGIF